MSYTNAPTRPALGHVLELASFLGNESEAPLEAAPARSATVLDGEPSSGLFIPGWMLLALGIGIPVLMTYAGVSAYKRPKRGEG
jgi:hypothetical protein